MMAWIVWFALAPQLYWLDRVVAGALGTPAWGVFDLSIALALGLTLRTRALPGLLLCAAIGRSLLGDGPVALHVLALGLPVAALIPLRSVFFHGSILWRVVAAAFLALAVPRVAIFFARLSDAALDAARAPSIGSVAAASVVVPAAAWLLCRLPPLSAFVERAS